MSETSLSVVFQYLQESVAGKSMSEWLQNVPISDAERNILAWKLTHVCLSYYKKEYRGINTVVAYENLIEDLEMYFKCVHRNIFDHINDALPFFLYHYVIGKYGHVSIDKSFKQELDTITQEMMSMEENDAIPLLPFADNEHTFPPRP